MSGRSDRIDSDPGFLLDDAEDLAGYVLPNFADLDEGMQDYWLYGWPNDMAIAKGLERSYRVGEMSTEQEKRYLKLKAKLREPGGGGFAGGIASYTVRLDDGELITVRAEEVRVL